jgi:hypothetical protein
MITSAAFTTAPAFAAPAAIADSGSASGSATYGHDFIELISCLLKGSVTGSKAPLC